MGQVERLQGTSPIKRLISSLDVPEMLDCTFIVGEEKEQIKASKILLSSVSEVFERIFFGEMSTNDPIEIPDVEPCIFKKFLRMCIYMLTDKGNKLEEDALSRDDALKIYPLADMYMINSLIKLLINILKPNSANDFYENIRLASCYSVEELMVSNIEFLTRRAHILDDKQFLDISSSTVVRIFKENYFEVYSEVQVFYAALKWASARFQKKCVPDECSDVRKVLEEEGILKLIRFLSMSLDDFMNGPYKSGVLTEEKSSAIISNIKRCDSTSNITEESSLPDTLSQLHNGRWEKSFKYCQSWRTADIFLFSNDYERKSEYQSKFLMPIIKVFCVCGVTLSPRPSLHPSDSEDYDENIIVRMFVVDATGVCDVFLDSGKYKGKVRFDTSVYVSFNGEKIWECYDKILFIVKYENEEWRKYCLPSSSINNGVFKHIEGPNTIMKIHYGVYDENFNPLKKC